MKKIFLAILAIMAFALHLRADVPEPSDFAVGLRIEADPGEAFYQIRLSEEVYAKIVREDFGDIRVFTTRKKK